ncbi:MAG: P-loop NTPase fold protein [Betaproteobacteria bacterium]
MWHDVETSTDLLNFSVVADTAAQLIRDSAGEPLSIGISGSWGVGKSSLVKMVAESLKKTDDADKKYVFLEFNAWLYQGYDDARMALLQSVSDKLVKEAEERKDFLEKAKDFAKRVNWLRGAKLLAPVFQGLVVGGALAGPVGAVVGAVGGLLKSDGMPSAEDLAKVRTAYSELQPELKELLKDKEDVSLPKEIAGLRKAFEGLLKDMDVTLVVLVDDLDRCLPDTAISTLEAMRLLLFMPRTAFIIAADEQMIRGAVQAHFKGANLTDELVTSYFDKLIQVPLRVPRLGITEVKAYLVLLFADLAERRGELHPDVRKAAQVMVLDAVKKSWAGALSRKTIAEAFGQATAFTQKIDLADQLAPVLATADHIAGNPRLIKRFMNNLLIRETIAKAQGMTVAFEELVKLQLFERCASPAAFEFLIKAVGESEDGKPKFFDGIELALAKGDAYKAPDPSWDARFIGDWLKLAPQLAGVDLRALLYLSKDRGTSLAVFDELSPDGRGLLDAVLEAKTIVEPLVKQLQALGETEAERVLTRLMRRARSDQWATVSLSRCLHVTRAFPQLGSLFVGLLQEIPAAQRPAPLLPNIRDETWAKELLALWAVDTNSPQSVKNALKAFQGRQ